MKKEALLRDGFELETYRLAHQTLCIKDINFETESIVGYVELVIYPQIPDLKRVKINCKQCKIFRIAFNETEEANFVYFDPMLEICKGKSKQRNLDYFEMQHYTAATDADPDYRNGEVTVTIPLELLPIVQEMRAFRICIEFSLDHPAGGIKFVVPDMDGTMLDRAAHLFTYGHENSSRLWFPCIDRFSELCTWKLEFTVNMVMTAVSCGDLIETVYTADLRKKTYHYYLSTPTAAPNIALAVGPFEVLVDPQMHEVTHFCLPHLMPLLKHTTASLHEVFEFFEELLSIRYPYSCYKQVFVDMAYQDISPYATMSICSLNLLYSKKVIDQIPLTRQTLAHGVAQQFFGCFISMNSWFDAWLVKGLSSYLCSLLRKNTFGMNDYRYYVAKEMRDVCDHEQNIGPVVLDPSKTRVDIAHYFPTKHSHTISPKYMSIYNKKSHLIVRMLEIRIGNKLILQVLNKLLSLAGNASQQKFYTKTWSNMLISTSSFLRCISTVTGKDVEAFMDQWVYQGGIAQFIGTFVFNRKRNVVELELKHHWTAKGAVKYAGPLTVALQELDGTYNHPFMVEENKTKFEFTCHSKSRRQKKKKIPLCTGEEVDMDLGDTDVDSPMLWLRVDPDLTILRVIKLEQPDFMWQYLLRYERCVVAQYEAICALEGHPTAKTRFALTDTIENEKCFYRIRIDAANCLAKVANAQGMSWNGPPAMINIFRKMFGSHSCPTIVRVNNFSNLQNYFIQKAMPLAMATLRTEHGCCPPEVLQFILDLFKYNDNEKNKYYDNYYRAALVDALAATLTPAASIVSITGICPSTDALTPETRSILEEVTGYLNLEKLLPSYRLTVTVSCLKAIRTLQKFGHLPRETTVLKCYATEGNFIDVRLAALEALVDFTAVEKDADLFSWLLDVVERDPDPYLRFRVVEMFIENPPFSKRDTNAALSNEALVDRLWTLMNCTLAHDSRLRCAVADFYHTLFGRTRPSCLPIPDSVVVLNLKEKRTVTNPSFKTESIDAELMRSKSDKSEDSRGSVGHSSFTDFSSFKFMSHSSQSPPLPCYNDEQSSRSPTNCPISSTSSSSQQIFTTVVAGANLLQDDYHDYQTLSDDITSTVTDSYNLSSFMEVPRAEFEVTIKDEDNSLKLSEDDSSSDSLPPAFHPPDVAEEFGAPPKIFSKFTSGAAALSSSAFLSLPGAGELRPTFSLAGSSIGSSSTSLFQPPGPTNSLFPESSGTFFSPTDASVMEESGSSSLFNPIGGSGFSATSESADMSYSSTNTETKSPFRYGEPRLKKKKLNPVVAGGAEVAGDVSSASDSPSPLAFRERSSSPDDYV